MSERKCEACRLSFDQICELKSRISELEAYVRTVVDEVLFPLSHRQGDGLALIAEGLGSESATLLNRRKS